MTAGTTTSFARLVDELVVGARADRDGVFNTLDAINRQTRAVSDRLAAEVDQFLAAAAPKPAGQASEDAHDARFDPEDEWDLPRTSAPPHADTQPGRGVRSSTSDDDDDLPETWLR